MKWLVNFLTAEKFSINHLVVGVAVWAAISLGVYIAAVAIYVIGVIYCAAMQNLNPPNQ